MNTNKSMVILGASNNKQRYSFKVMQLALNQGLKVFLVHPKLKEIEGIKVFNSLSALESAMLISNSNNLNKQEINNNYLVDTLTLYVRKEIALTQVNNIVKLKPRRVIANPGADDADTINALKNAGLHVQVACTLVLLTTGQY